MVLIALFDGKWSVKNVKDKHDNLWVYADSDEQCGYTGQAIIRDQKNTVGIPMMKNTTTKSYYIDEEFELNCIKIKRALKRIKIMLKLDNYKVLVIPKSGFGKGH